MSRGWPKVEHLQHFSELINILIGQVTVNAETMVLHAEARLGLFQKLLEILS